MTALPPDFFDGPLWQERRVYSRAEAWLDCWRAAALPIGQCFIGGRFVEVSPYAFIASESHLGKRWKWSRRKVHSFLARLVAEKMVCITRDKGLQLISLCNPENSDHASTTKAPGKEAP